MWANSSSSAWEASLRVHLAKKNTRTALTHASHTGPLRVQRPFYPEGELCHLYFLHPPGGIVGGDKLAYEVSVGSGAKGLITAPGANKVYRSKGPKAEIKQHFRVEKEATLEWLPPGTIFFAGANAAFTSTYQLASGAGLIACETLCFGRPVMGETFDSGNVTSRLQVTLDERLVINEVLRVSAGAAVLSGYAMQATLLVYPATDAMLSRVQALVAPSRFPGGATLLENILVIRLLAEDNIPLERMVRALWEAVRHDIVGKVPLAPRIWAT